jgi:hypothetical protein
LNDVAPVGWLLAHELVRVHRLLHHLMRHLMDQSRCFTHTSADDFKALAN